MDRLIKEILKLKKEKNAVIMAHYYMSSDVKRVSDMTGDSYFLAEEATRIESNTVVLCGVSFMGESVKLLNPEKTVLLPDMLADCPMAHMYTVEEINDIRNQYEDVAVVCYINSSAELKGLSDVCVTSANAVKVVRELTNKNIYFLPDGNLGRFVASQIPEKHFILHNGFCYVHADIKTADVRKLIQQIPSAKVLAHPECTEDIIMLADFVGSTAGIISYAASDMADDYIICTEDGVLHDLQEGNPKKRFYFPGNPQCSGMKRITLQKIKHVLQTGENEVIVDEIYSDAARKALRRMLELSGK